MVYYWLYWGLLFLLLIMGIFRVIHWVYCAPFREPVKPFRGSRQADILGTRGSFPGTFSGTFPGLVFVKNGFGNNRKNIGYEYSVTKIWEIREKMRIWGLRGSGVSLLLLL